MLNPRELMEPSNSTAAVLTAILIGVPVVLYSIFQFYISYALGYVVATLATVEDTTPGASLRCTAAAMAADEADQRPETPPPAYRDEPDTKPTSQTAPLLDEAAVPAGLRILASETDPRPMTTSVRRTMKHLRQRGGRFAGLRGLGVGMVWLFLSCVMSGIFTAVLGTSTAVVGIVFVATQMGLMRVNLLWTHIVISEPSPRAWFRRFASRTAAKKVALPTLAWSLMQVAVPGVPAFVASFTSLPRALSTLPSGSGSGYGDALSTRVVLELLLVVAVSLFMVVHVWFPVTVAFVRCQASVLADDETPIVPFDRTFGGRVDPYSNGRDGRLSMRDAWRTFDWAATRRVAGVYVKLFAIQFTFSIFYVIYLIIAQVSIRAIANLSN